MNVVVIINSIHQGGAELSAIDLLKALRRKSHRIFLLLPVTHKISLDGLEQIEIIHLPFVAFVKSWNPLVILRFTWNVICCAWRIAKIIEDNRVNVIYANALKAIPYGIVTKLFCHRKLVWHVRDAVTSRLVHWLVIPFVNKIIVPSKFIRDQFSVGDNKLQLVCNGIDTTYFSKQRDAIPVSSNRDVKYVTMVAQFTEWKNITDFIQVARIVYSRDEDIHFVLVGDCLGDRDQQYRRKLMEEVNRSDRANIKLTGWLPNVKNIYAYTDVLVHTSIDEPFGRVIVEAMAMEIPVIAYRSGGPAETVVDDQTGYLVSPRDCQALSEKLISLLCAPDTMKQFGAMGRQRVEYYFNAEAQAELIEELLTTNAG